MTDLFEDYQNQPLKLRAIVSEIEEKSLTGLDYPDLVLFQSRCEAIGYTFDYDLSGTPYDLKAIKK
jgi:hypothetical protein